VRRSSLFILIAMMVMAATARAQRNPVWASVDLRVATADRVFVGRIARMEPAVGDAAQNERHQTVVIGVASTLKGKVPAKVELNIEEDLWSALNHAGIFCEGCAARKHRLLVMLQPDERNVGGMEILDLDANNILDVTGDLHVITTSEALMAAVRDEVKRCPGVLPSKENVAWGPSKTFMPGTEFHNYTVYVPFDDRQAALARHVLATQEAPSGVSGALDNDRPAAAFILGHFHAQKNIPYMKTLLVDAQLEHAVLGRLDYPVRKAAYDSLVQCGATFAKPLLHVDVKEPWDGKVPAE
jgi:hypothetical protein